MTELEKHYKDLSEYYSKINSTIELDNLIEYLKDTKNNLINIMENR